MTSSTLIPLDIHTTGGRRSPTATPPRRASAVYPHQCTIMGRRYGRSAPASLVGGALPSARPCVSGRRGYLATRHADAIPCAGRGQARRVLPGDDGSCRCGAWWKSAGDLDREHVSWQHTDHTSIFPCRYNQGGSQRDGHGRETGEAALRKHPVPGTIRGAFDDARDGIHPSTPHVENHRRVDRGGAVRVTRRIPYRGPSRSACDSMCDHHEGHAL